MSPDVVDRAFRPFFTTKPVGLGTGLGLSMIYGFAKQSRGHLRISSEEGIGRDRPLIGGSWSERYDRSDMLPAGDSRMEWTLRLVGTEIDGQSRSWEVMAISRPDGLGDIAALGLTLAEAKLLLVQVQQEVVAAQARQHTLFRPDCQSCSGRCHVKGWRPHRIATLFGEVGVKLPRLACAGGGCGETGGGWPSHRRSGGRQVFGAVTRAETGITALIQRALETVGGTDTTKVTAFTDGCPGLRTVLVNAGVTKPPILDWFHIAMRLQHTKLVAASLSPDDPDRVTAKAVIVAEVERLHWRIWNGKAKNAQRSTKRIRKVMHVFKGEHSQGAKGVPSRKLWHALHAIDKYLRDQAAWLVNYAKRYRAGERVGTSITEGMANFLVNRRMNKSQQMRWSRDGADLLLQVRCAVYNGTLGAGFGHRFDRIAKADPAFAQAA